MIYLIRFLKEQKGMSDAIGLRSKQLRFTFFANIIKSLTQRFRKGAERPINDEYII